MAACVAMATLAAGQVMSGRWRGQTVGRTAMHLHHAHTDTCGNDSRRVSLCARGSDDMAVLNQQHDV